MVTGKKRMLVGVDRGTLRDRALHSLRAAIYAGDLAPGARLLEVDLSVALKVSRGTIREAILRLAEEGLVEVESHLGSYVRLLDGQEISDIYAVRAALEGLAAANAAARPRSETEPVLKAALNRLEKANGGSIAGRIAADIAFHEAICELSNNTWLLTTWRRLSGPIRAALMSAGETSVRRPRSMALHRNVMEAIIRGDPAVANRILVEHLTGSAVYLRDSLDRNPVSGR